MTSLCGTLGSLGSREDGDAPASSSLGGSPGSSCPRIVRRSYKRAILLSGYCLTKTKVNAVDSVASAPPKLLIKMDNCAKIPCAMVTGIDVSVTMTR